MLKYRYSYDSLQYSISLFKGISLIFAAACLVIITVLALIDVTILRADAQITSPQRQSVNKTNTAPDMITQEEPSTYQAGMPLTVKITSPQKGQEVPVGELTIGGISSDTRDTDCEVLVILNGIKPYQPVSPTGSNGSGGGSSPEDYATWTYTLSPEYALIKEGENKITSKISCQPNEEEPAFSSNLKHYSVNVTGLDNNAGSSSLSTQNATGKLNAAAVNDSDMLNNATTIFVVPVPSDLLPQLSNLDGDGSEDDKNNNNPDEGDDSNEGDDGDAENNGKGQGKAKGHGKNKG